MKKYQSILFFIGALFMFSSCFKPECLDQEFLDFDKMDLHCSTEVPLNENLSFHLRPTEIFYLGVNVPRINQFTSNFSSGCDAGWGGLRHPFRTIEVVSNSDFSAEYPAGTLLNPLVDINPVGINSFINLDLVNISNNYESPMTISARPTLSMEHQITVRLFKANGVVLEAKSDVITWE